ncbi:PucR family transcriptional regulator [Rhodococcus sp. NPDC058521]|uniref:PucR family transcriptional regulator n=1 Tax=Rhodococcus sp. NPDC058521 TaxID=3346536 RepID=UPI00365AC412
MPASSQFSNLRAVAGSLVGHFAANVIPCGNLPREELSGDVTNVTMGCLRLAMDMLDKRRPPTDEELNGFRESSAQWAREGIPLETILEVLHEGFRLGWLHVVSGAEGADIEDLTQGGELLISMLSRVTVAATESYITELKVVASEHHTAAHTLVTALLAGRAGAAMERQFGIDVASEYVVLAVYLPKHADENDPAINSAVPARRKLRRVQAELAKVCGRTALSLLSTEGGTVLLPGSPTDEWVDSLVAQLSTAAEVDITASAVTAETADVPHASERSHELLDLAQLLHGTPKVYRMSDLVFEYQMMRPGAGREYLVALLDPLEKTPDLINTLEVHLQNDLNRQRTARQLHVHTNTVDYRLKRVAELTGLDPVRPSGLRPLQAALVARRLAMSAR